MICAIACLGVCHGMPWCVPWHDHGVPRLAMACLGVCHDKPWAGLPRHALECATACPWGAATACLGVCHGLACRGGMPWSVPRLVMACLGVCHGMPRCVPRLALTCAISWLGAPMACLGVCHGLPWHAHEQCKPRLVACPWATHGMPWCVPRHAHGQGQPRLVACPWGATASRDMPWCVPWPGHGLPTACLGVCHDKS